MNEKQKKTLKIFLSLACSIVLSITGLVAFLLYQKQLASQGDYFDRLVAKQHMAWATPTMALLVGVGIAALLLFVGLWKIQKTPEK